MRECPRCHVHKDASEFYSRRGYEGKSVYCKSCATNQTIERQRAFKQKCINYKGSKCCKCGYDKCPGALEFHHLDPAGKDFSISRIKLTKFDERATNELDKCILVCANCHREIHYALVPEPPSKR